MNARTFCYWLQGYFELITPTTVPEKAVNIISKHLELVADSERGVFCAWLQGCLDITEGKAWSAAQTKKVKEKLAQEFVNVIDASYPPAVRQTLLNIHNKPQNALSAGLQSGLGGPRYAC